MEFSMSVPGAQVQQPQGWGPLPDPATHYSHTQHSHPHTPSTFYSPSQHSPSQSPPTAPQAPATNVNVNDQGQRPTHLSRTPSGLSLNLSSLSVTSPTNHSPINPPGGGVSLPPLPTNTSSPGSVNSAAAANPVVGANVNTTSPIVGGNGGVWGHHHQQSLGGHYSLDGTVSSADQSHSYPHQTHYHPPSHNRGLRISTTALPARSSPVSAGSGPTVSIASPANLSNSIGQGVNSRKRSYSGSSVGQSQSSISIGPGAGGSTSSSASSSQQSISDLVNGTSGGVGPTNTSTGGALLDIEETDPEFEHDGGDLELDNDAPPLSAISGYADDVDTPMDLGFDDFSRGGRQSQSGAGATGRGSQNHNHAGGMKYRNGGSPIDGSSGEEMNASGTGAGGLNGGTQNLGPMAKSSVATNNFVTKLYQMINDPKSSHFISWTELGTSFVVSNVGEFSRSILGSHFKHNNFSSFVRQLNMYGFHKINRTPRAQRTSTDAQTWEFSHHKFLRGRPDLLEEIKRKALEPDPAIKHRVELPGELAAQMNAMREENRRIMGELVAEKRRSEKLVNVVARVCDWLTKNFPGSIPPFPAELLDGMESPNIFITSPTSTTSRGFPPPLSMTGLHTIHTMSPGSSPTTTDFSATPHMGHAVHHTHNHSLSRQQSFHHLQGYPRDDSPSTSGQGTGDMSIDLSFDESDGSQRSSAKRQRLSSTDELEMEMAMNHHHAHPNVGNGTHSHPHSVSASTLSSPITGPNSGNPLTGSGGGMVGVMSGLGVLSNAVQGGLSPPKKMSRARSDSAPLRYGGFGGPLNPPVSAGAASPYLTAGGRPRSGSGMAPMGHPGMGAGQQGPGRLIVPSIGMPRNAPLPR